VIKCSTYICFSTFQSESSFDYCTLILWVLQLIFTGPINVHSVFHQCNQFRSCSLSFNFSLSGSVHIIFEFWSLIIRALMQVVAYDEDHSERQRIMEKVRTRSSTIALASSNSGSQLKSSDSAAWKGDQKLGRLFKAAEANK
jgi:hypothetical protein